MSVGGSAPEQGNTTDPAPTPALRVRNLSVGFGRAAPVVQAVSFDVAPGECLAIVGESGSGKSVTARSLLGLAGQGALVTADELALAGRSVLGLSEAAWRHRRGRDVGLVLQDALASLDPLRPIAREIGDSLRLHTRQSEAERSRRVLAVLESVGLADPHLYTGRRSGELSGGQRQRALIAAALALDPPLLVADEPTTALDVTVQAQVLELIERVRDRGTAIVLISHDLAVVSRIADRVAVMHSGRIIETGPTSQVLQNPWHAQTRRMLAAVPVDKPRGTRLAPAGPAKPAATGRAIVVESRPEQPHNSPASPGTSPATPAPALEATGLRKSFRGPHGSVYTAVDDVSFRLERGTTLGIVGESGSGKTTTARLSLALAAADAGEVRLLGEAWSTLGESERRARRPLIGAVYQDVLASFDPRLTVREILGHADAAPRARLARARRTSPAARRVARAERDQRIRTLLDEVGLASTVLDRRPTDLSGGQRQRVGIARALASRPEILVCDEPVSALDVSVQAQVLDLLDDVQREHSLSLLFISHDLGVIQHVSDSVAVMHNGTVVESGPADQVFGAPRNPYTQALLGAVPRLS
jgi:peptide/nickel transport system ATP-binding protein